MAAPSRTSNGRLLLSTEPGHASNGDNQGDVRQQIANLTDLVRQVVGNAVVLPGDGGPSDPLNATFELYVDPVRGSDAFAHGEFSFYDPPGLSVDETIQNKLKRISKQRMTCGYTRERPFKTVNRAAIEAAIITSRSWFINDPKTHVDCIVIYLSAGVHIAYNDPGTGAATSGWVDGYEPGIADLIAFNPPEGGIILPRYASIQGADLRKCTIRPNYVPPTQDEADDYSNRSAIFRLTPGSLNFGFTFFDHWTEKRSHHLLSCFEFASQPQLVNFYDRVRAACLTGGDLDAARLVPRPSEVGVVSPAIDQTQAPTESWDVVASASAYVYNCSVRSIYGLAGIFGNGDLVGGFKSMVSAQFTGVSLQRDLSCWQVYKQNTWQTPANYAEYINADPDDVRMNPKRMSRHITMVNDAFAQLVSVFAIGQGIHHYTDNGGEITITNSNSSFGGCAAISKGYRGLAYQIDNGWNLSRIKFPTNLKDKAGNKTKINLGSVAATVANNATVIELVEPLQVSGNNSAQPAVLDRDGYSLRPGTLIWARNNVGEDFYSYLANPPWDQADPGKINITQPFVNERGIKPGDPNTTGIIQVDAPDLEGALIYVRRLKDTRTKDERIFSLQLENTTPTRTPVRDFIFQLDPSDSAVSSELDRKNEVLLVTSTLSLSAPNTGVSTVAEVTLRRGGTPINWQKNTFYRIGETILYANKHWTCSVEHTSGNGFAADKWAESYVHMPENYAPEDFRKSEGSSIIFDRDTDAVENSRYLGYNLTTCWTADPEIVRQLRTNCDYRALSLLFRAMGMIPGEVDNLLVPRDKGDRVLDPGTPGLPGMTEPTGGRVAGWANWAVVFYRPSVLRLYSHAWEWAGWLNYSKSLPAVQRELSPQNKYTYYFTNDTGGRVYATGNNEDGFGVTPAGLINISTGETQSVESIGVSSEDFDVAAISGFDSLQVGDLRVGRISNEINFDALPLATTEARGAVELATELDVDRALKEGLKFVEETDSVLSIKNLPAISDWVGKEIGRLGREYSVMYVCEGVVMRREPDGAYRADPATIPDRVWADVKNEAVSIHDVGTWTGVVPLEGSVAYAFCRQLIFGDLNDVFSLLANRTVETNDLFIFMYGTTSLKNNIVHSGVGRITIQSGPSSNLDTKGRGAKLYMNNFYISLTLAEKLVLADLDLYSHDTGKTTRKSGRHTMIACGSALDGNGYGEIEIGNCSVAMYVAANNICLCFNCGGTLSINPRTFARRMDRKVNSFDVDFDNQAPAGALFNWCGIAWSRRLSINTQVFGSTEDEAVRKRMGINLRVRMASSAAITQVFRAFTAQEVIYSAYSWQPGSPPTFGFGADWRISLADFQSPRFHPLF